MKKLVLFMAVIFAVTFVNAQTKTEIKVADLQKAITDHIAANYAGFTIEKAFKVDSKGVITFKVHVSKATEKLTLVYDKDGKFVKKIVAEPKPANAPKKVTKEPKVEKAPKTGK
jgi:hypothetical protein